MKGKGKEAELALIRQYGRLNKAKYILGLMADKCFSCKGI